MQDPQQQIDDLTKRLDDFKAVFDQHVHNGVDSSLISPRNVILAYQMTPTQLAAYIAGSANNGDEFLNYDGTNYEHYAFVGGVWKKAALT